MEPEVKITREEILEKLHNGIVNVLFLKSDGTEREMKATLLAEHLPPAKEVSENEVKKERKVNEEVVVAWDMDKQAWRSFRLDSVITVS